MSGQQGDVLLFQTDNDGDICVEGGVVTMSGGLETAAYLSLFGGNEDDDGVGAEHNWWGNLDETESAREYRSETQNLLQAIPATAANLLKIEEAARRDLAWLVEVGAALDVVVLATIPALHTVKITVSFGGDISLEFVENWQASV
jgi:phage gp46-like protein